MLNSEILQDAYEGARQCTTDRVSSRLKMLLFAWGIAPLTACNRKRDDWREPVATQRLHSFGFSALLMGHTVKHRHNEVPQILSHQAIQGNANIFRHNKQFLGWDCTSTKLLRVTGHFLIILSFQIYLSGWFSQKNSAWGQFAHPAALLTFPNDATWCLRWFFRSGSCRYCARQSAAFPLSLLMKISCAFILLRGYSANADRSQRSFFDKL